MSSPREAWRQARARITGVKENEMEHQVLCICLTVCDYLHGRLLQPHIMRPCSGCTAVLSPPHDCRNRAGLLGEGVGPQGTREHPGS